jgi:spermidine synthase
LLGQGREQVARQLGLTYAFNTLGSIIGALAGAFLLIPSLGATSTWRAMALVLVALALAAALLHLSHSGARQLRAVGAAALFAFVTIVLASGTGPTAIWRHSPIGAGRVDLTGLGRNELKEWMISRERRLLWQRDGVESAVAADVANGVSFLVNGKSDGSVSMDRGTQGMLALLPVILHHDPRHVFVLGLGTGMSAGWAAASPDVERVDVAELEPAVLEVARLCSPANRRVLEQKKTRIHLGDGREYLLTTRERYDVIASEPSNPYRAGVASLFTREFYQAAEQRLKPRGYFAQWVQAYEIDVATLRMVLRTMTSVFPVIEIWQTQPDDLLLIASREPRTYQMGLVRQRARSEPYREALRRFWLSEDAEAVLAHSVMNARMTTELVRAAPGPINTDDNSLLEYSFARNVGISHEPLGLRLLELSLARGSTEPQISGHLDRARVAELRPRGWFISEERAPDLE